MKNDSQEAETNPSNEYPEWADWDHCGYRESELAPPCPGAALKPNHRCIAHLDRINLTEMLTEESFVLDLRGVKVPAGMSRRLSTAFSQTPPGRNKRGEQRWFLRDIRLDHAIFPEHLSISKVSVKNNISMDAAVFQGNFFFTESEIGSIDFGRYNQTQIAGDLLISNVRAEGIFANKLVVSGKTLLIDMVTDSGINLSNAWFTQLVTLRVTCPLLLLADAVFEKGFLAQVGEADVKLDRASLGAPSTLARHLADPYERPAFIVPPSDAGPPRLLSFAGCDLSNVTLHNVDLRACRFWEGFGLDKLTIGGRLILSAAPGRWHTRRKVVGDEQLWRSVYGPTRSKRLWELPPVALPRLEHDADLRRDALRGDDASGDARTVASIYRELRKGLEDRKDEPGAADFYYGEMEMRRHGAESKFELILLTIYWLISGYALRSWRAFASLIVVLVVATVGFTSFGFANTRTTVYVPVRQQIVQRQVPGPPTYMTATVEGNRPGLADAVDFTLESATSLLREPQTQAPLTTFGKALEVMLRLIGPFLLGLALLALRGRVKR